MNLPFRKYSVEDDDTYPAFYMLTVTDPDGFKLVLERKLTYEVALHAALDFQATENAAAFDTGRRQSSN